MNLVRFASKSEIRHWPGLVGLIAMAACCAALSAAPAAAQTVGAMGDEPECTHNPAAPKCVVAEVFKLTQLCRPVCPPAPVNTTRPTVSGAAVDGGFVTATRGSWANDPQVYAVEWERCDAVGVGCEAIPGQHDWSYQLRTEDLGHFVRVKVTAANGGGFSFPAYSDPVGPVQPGPPVRQSDPAILGAPVEGQLLTATNGTWRGTAPTSYAYQWLSCDADGTNCTAIAGATGASYALTEDDVGSAIQVQVTASNAQGSGTARSRPVGPVESLAPPGPPAAEDDAIDDETSMLAGSWIGLDGEAAVQLDAGQITLEEALQLSAASGRPPYHCNARIGWKVGGLRTIHQEGPDVKQRTVRWSGTVTCTGGAQAVFFHGYSFLDRLNNNVFSRYSTGTTYSVARTGVVMKAKTSGQTLEGPRRKLKRVQWHSNIELPPPYQWANDEPFGDLKGINEEKSHCDRYSAVSSGPQYLNGIGCTLYGHRFR